MTTPQRYADRFTTINGLSVHTFPELEYEYDSGQSLRQPMAAGVGAHYAHRFGGTMPGLKDTGVERIRGNVSGDTVQEVDALKDDLRAMQDIGLGKLWTVDADGDRRWAYAALASLPEIVTATRHGLWSPVVIEFTRWSDWYGETPITGSRVVTATPDTWTITMTGNATTGHAVFRLRANNSTGYTNPVLRNEEMGQQVSSARDASAASSELKIDSWAYLVAHSTDDGASYTPDWANVTLPAAQVALIELRPGDNLFRYTNTGTPAVTIEWTIYPAWH